MTWENLILTAAGLLIVGAIAFMWNNFLSLSQDTYRKKETEELIDLKTEPLAVSLNHLAEVLKSLGAVTEKLTETLAEMHHDVIYMKVVHEQKTERHAEPR